MSQITTHVLDTSSGRPAAGVKISLQKNSNNEWKEIAKGITNTDGRVSDLLAKESVLDSGVYKLIFETNEYFNQLHIQSFYPFVEIVFFIKDAEHYHVPLLLNPFGYTTYRGS